MSDTAIGIPITFQVFRRLYPGRELQYTQFLFDHMGKDEMVTLGAIHGGQQYITYSKPGTEGAPMGLARFLIDGDAAVETEGGATTTGADQI